ncbi:MAG: hypothetical protein AAF349_24350, partial [Cyanobacteria bacterium P01_A01_bin.68]
METKTVFKKNQIPTNITQEKLSRIFVWGVWLLMLIIAFTCVIKYGKNIPLAEDWNLVAPLTGNDPDLLGGLWVQNNEHRVPLPRLIFLILLKLTSDFRVGMFFNVIILGTMAFLMTLTARYLRGGKTDFADAVFPIALLHIGNWENLVWSWQLSFVLPVALILGILLLLIIQPTLSSKWVAVMAGVSLICLPLCGAIGLVFIPSLVPWFIYRGVVSIKLSSNINQSKLASYILISSAITALTIAILYFIGYEKPTWNPPSPSIAESLKTTAKYLALGLGPAAKKSWGLSVMLAFGLLIPSIAIALRAVLSRKDVEKQRVLGISIFSLGVTALALGIGHGRAGLVPTVGLPMRYVTLAVVGFLSAFFIWELYGKPLHKKIFQRGLLILMCILLPWNTNMGVQWGNWYLAGMNKFEQDVVSGIPASELAKRHKDFLIHWWDEEKLVQHMKMLQDAKIGI